MGESSDVKAEGGGTANHAGAISAPRAPQVLPLAENHRNRNALSDAETDSHEDSSEAETVILEEDRHLDRTGPPGRPIKPLRRLQRRIHSSSDGSGSDSDSDVSIEKHHKHPAFHRRKDSTASSSSRGPPARSHADGRGRNSRSMSPAVGAGPFQPLRKDGSPIRDASGRLLLQKLCDKGDYERVKQLVEMGVDVNDRDYAGNTALHDAALKGHLKIVELLLDHGAIMDIRSGVADLDTPLIDASSRGHIEIVKLLLARGADPRIFNAQGKSALDFVDPDSDEAEDLERLLKDAVLKCRKRRESDPADHDESVRALSYDPTHSAPGTFPPADLHATTNRRHGSGDETADGAVKRRGARSQSIRNDLLWMDLTTKTGRDLVYQKAADGDLQYVGRSLEEGWQPDADCLVLAAKHGHTDIVGLLLAFGVDGDGVNKEGVTALHETVGRGHLDTIKLLLNSGADPSWLDSQGRSYLDLAKEALGSDDEESVVIKNAVTKARSEPRKRADVSDRRRKMSTTSVSEERLVKKRKKAKPENGHATRPVKTESDHSDVSAPRSRKGSNSDTPQSRKGSISDGRLLKDAEAKKLAHKHKEGGQEERRKLSDKEREDLRSSKLAEKEKEEHRTKKRLEKEQEELRVKKLEKEDEVRAKQQAEREQEVLQAKAQAQKQAEKEKDDERYRNQKKKDDEARVKALAMKHAAEKLREAERKRQREKEMEQRELIEAQKEKERQERTKQMLKNLEAEEKRKQQKLKEEQEYEATRKREELEMQEKKRQIELEQDQERRRMLIKKRDIELRRNFPYAIRMANYGHRSFEEMQLFLPLLSRSFMPGVAISKPGSLSSCYFLDVQISLLLGIPNVYQSYPELTRKLVTGQEKERMWSMLVPWICKPLDPFEEVADSGVLADRLDDKRKFMGMPLFWLRADEVVDKLFSKESPELFANFQSYVVQVDIDYDDAEFVNAVSSLPPALASLATKLPLRVRAKLESRFSPSSWI